MTSKRESALGRLGIGWVFPGPPVAGPRDAVEFACVPFLDSPGAGPQPMFEIQAKQRQQFTPLADGHGVDATALQRPHRAYNPLGQARERTGTPGAQLAEPVGELDQALAAIARQTGATLHIYPRPGPAARRVILRDERDDRGTRHLDAALEHDGTLRITGHDQGLRVSEFWGAAITSYDWVYVIAADRISALITVLGGYDGDDVLALLAACHQRAGGQISDLMTDPDVAACRRQVWQSATGKVGSARMGGVGCLRSAIPRGETAWWQGGALLLAGRGPRGAGLVSSRQPQRRGRAALSWDRRDVIGGPFL